MLRIFRPLVAPLLHRFHWQVRTAVEVALADTSVASLSGRLEEQAQALRLMNQVLTARLETLQVGLDAVRLDGIELLGSSGQLGSIIPMGPDFLVRTPEGFLLAPAEDLALLLALHESKGRLEPGMIRVLQALLKEGDVAVDVGAHIGLTVFPAAKAVGASGHIIAIEPSSRIGTLLSRSMALNGLSKQVTVHHCAAGEVSGTAMLNIGSVFGHSSLLPFAGATEADEVEVRCVDELIEPGRRIRLTKIDAEGFEPQILRGMSRVVAENPELAVLVEFGLAPLHRAGIALEDWLKTVRAPDFTVYEIEEPTGRLKPLRPLTELTENLSLNLLLLRQPPEAFPGLVFS